MSLWKTLSMNLKKILRVVLLRPVFFVTDAVERPKLILKGT